MTGPIPPPSPRDDPPLRWLTTAQRRLIGLILVLAAAGAAYRFVYATGFQQTAALYIGVPAVLAIGLTALPRSKSATGMALKGSMLGLLIAGIVTPEGLICLVFAAPLVALVAIGVGAAVDISRTRQRRQGPTLMIVALPLLALSLEGVIGSPVDAHEQVTATVQVAASPASVRAALAAPPAFASAPTGFLAFGFNRPVGGTGSGLALGDERTIDFSGGTHDDHPVRLVIGDDATDHHTDHRSQMHLRVTETTGDRVVFTITSDTTMLARWARLERATVTWTPTVTGGTSVTWQFDYERLLNPSFYFGPLERFGLQHAASYLLDTQVMDRVA